MPFSNCVFMRRPYLKMRATVNNFILKNSIVFIETNDEGAQTSNFVACTITKTVMILFQFLNSVHVARRKLAHNGWTN
jgi:hypothetical protein